MTLHYLPSLALVSLMVACGGSTSAIDGPGTGGADADPKPFVGTWSCAGSTTSAITAPVASTTSSPSDEREVFVVGDDGVLTGTFGNADGSPGDDCPLRYSVSGSSAIAAAGQECPWFFGGWSLHDSTFVVSGDAATFTMDVTVANAEGTGPDGGAAIVSGSLEVAGSCTRQ